MAWHMVMRWCLPTRDGTTVKGCVEEVHERQVHDSSQSWTVFWLWDDMDSQKTDWLRIQQDVKQINYFIVLIEIEWAQYVDMIYNICTQ